MSSARAPAIFRPAPRVVPAGFARPLGRGRIGSLLVARCLFLAWPFLPRRRLRPRLLVARCVLARLDTRGLLAGPTAARRPLAARHRRAVAIAEVLLRIGGRSATTFTPLPRLAPG